MSPSFFLRPLLAPASVAVVGASSKPGSIGRIVMENLLEAIVATRSDFATVIAERNLNTLWTRMEEQSRAALNVQPWIISNGSESSAFFPSHLATMGFNLLQVRSNIVEIRSVLDR